MKIFDSKLETLKSTAANSGVSPPNFAVPATLPEPGSPWGANGLRKRRSLSDGAFALVQVCTDFVCACIALPLSLIVLSLFSTAPSNSIHLVRSNTVRDCLYPVAAIAALALGGMYRASHRRLQPSAFLEIRDLSFGVGSGCVLALGAGAFFHANWGMREPNATQLVLAAMVTVAVISAGRIVMRRFLHSVSTTRVLVVGSGKLVERIALSVQQDSGMTLVGRAVDADVVDEGALGSVCDLPALCRQLDVHRILVAAPDCVSAASLNTYRQLQESVHIAMVPQYFELVSWRSRLTDLSGLPFLEIARPHLSLWDQFMKRLFDICISSLVLLVTSPVLLVVAVAVKLSSPGPVFFRQVRVGRHRSPFTITKIRTMRMERDPQCEGDDVAEDDQEGRPLHEIRGKLLERGRITRCGALLRRTGIDEIPQFINVFRGDMSVVGPRPFVPEESRMAGWSTRRFEVRPGITGLWQVSGRNDLSRSDLVQLDYLYVASWSLWWDLKIMWETPKTMARGTGAY